MATKEKLAKARRAHKESKGKNGGGGKVRLTELEKILLVNGGVAHFTRKNTNMRLGAPKRKGGKSRSED